MTFTPPITRRNHGRGHSYRDANGQRVPGVTTIMSKGVPKPALTNWAAETVASFAIDRWDELAALPPSERWKRLKKAPTADRDAAANRGTRVHALAARLLAGERVDVPEELAGHVEAYVRFLDEWHVRPVLSEFVVVSNAYGYAGTGDIIADLIATDQARAAWPAAGNAEWIRLLLDIKTSRSGVYGETALQLAGYRYGDFYLDGATERPIPVVHGCGVVHTRADGYSLVPVEAGPAELRALLYAKQVAEFCESSRDLVGEPLEAPAVAA